MGALAGRFGGVGVGVVMAVFSGSAMAGSFSLLGLDASYKLSLGYSLAVRMGDQASALVNAPVDPLQPEVLPSGQAIGFTHTGLSTTINLDDGNRNFDKYSPINNRLTSFGEFSLRKGNFGIVTSGAAFYDFAFQTSNDNDSPDTINKRNGPVDEFHPDAVSTNGERARVLEAYAFADFYLTDDVALNLRFGKQLVAWGESLFFPGIVSAQGPNDATKAFVPGAEIKEILLPAHQASFQLQMGFNYTLMGFYQLHFKPTEVFPVGDFFSVADVVGPGAEFAHGSINPASGAGCPGLLDLDPLPLDLSQLCMLATPVGALLNSEDTIKTIRGPDIIPDKDGQWGIGLKAQITDSTTLGFYHLRYHNHNPTVQLNFGFAPLGELPNGTPVTTALINQEVPVTYQIRYFDDITMNAVSFSTTLFGLNVGGEVIYREDIDLPVAAAVSGVISPIYSRGNTIQSNLSAIFVTNPRFWIYDEVAVAAETSFLYVDEVQAIDARPGLVPVGDGDTLFYDQKAAAYQFLVLPKGRNVFPGWDIGTPISVAHAFYNYASSAGTFGSLFGEGDVRLGLQVIAQYLQNLEFAVGYNWFLGDPGALVGDSPIPANAVADREYATFTIKYSL